MRNKALNTVSLDFTTLGKRGSKTFVFWVAYLILGTLSTKNLMLLIQLVKKVTTRPVSI